MKITKLTWQIFLVCMGVTLLSLITISVYASKTYKKLYITNLKNESLDKCFLIRHYLTPFLSDTANITKVDSICKAAGTEIGTRVTVINKSGNVLGDSEHDPSKMDSHVYRPEIIQAFTGINGFGQRLSTTLNCPMLYIAVPLVIDNQVGAVLRLSEPLKEISRNIQTFYIQIAIASVIALILISLASLSIAKTLSNPINEMKTGAQKIANGELDFRLRLPAGEEIRGLALALNTMAESLGERIKTTTRQKNELDAILSGMSDGVLAIDNSERIITINPAAAELLGITVKNAKNKLIYDIVRSSALQKFIQDTLDNSSQNETHFVLPDPSGKERHIHAKGKNIGNTNGTNCAILVLHDITSQKRLEILRKEFVANVSHELRTPLTSIKGFVETIINSEYTFPEDITKFLEIISKKTDHLCAMVDDIIDLSSIEKDAEQKEIQKSLVNVKNILDDITLACTQKVALKNIEIEILCDENTEVKTNGDLLEQALTNLVDNAIKYSTNGKRIVIKACQTDKDVQISVIDEGAGIPPEHQERIFERFYRVDKARSRKLGGTGLGLSIVKNICLLLGATVSVESVVGKGSNFTIALPVC
ncbi:MAG: ATP-binding protein [Fibrobacter sp.]|nr:ATP-binding protein [Fibrobacter sp.]